MLDELFAAAGAAAWGGVAFRRLLPFLSPGALEKVEALCPRPRTVLAAAFPYYAGDRPGNLSLYARGRDYHAVVVGRLTPICEALEKKYPGESFFPAADSSPLPEREAAWLAGMGLRGANGLLILPPYGSYVFLGTILTGAALELPERPPAPDCPRCGACRRACPAGALGEGGPDASRCLSELTQKKGALTGEETLSPSPVTIPAGGGGFTYHITYAPAGLTLELGLRAEDGTEYSQRVVGGSLAGTIPDIPGGTYQLFVRNSGDYDFQTTGHLNGDVDYNVTGALVFLTQSASEATASPEG